MGGGGGKWKKNVGVEYWYIDIYCSMKPETVFFYFVEPQNSITDINKKVKVRRNIFFN